MAEKNTKWHSTRKARMDELFAGKQFTVVEEFKSDEAVATPLGYKVKTGYRLAPVDGGDSFVVGKSLLNTLADEYSAVEKPEPKRRGRPRKEPIEQAETWAGRDMPGDASPVTQPGETYVNPNETQHFEG